MNYLILINSAPNYKYFFYRLGCALESQGNKVYYAVDSHRSCALEPLAEIDDNENSIFFDQYFEQHYHFQKEQSDYRFETTWGSYFFADFDRFLTHRFNLNKPKGYWEQTRVCLDDFFQEAMDKYDIHAVLYENVSNSFAYSAYRMMKQKGGIYLGLVGARLPNRFEIHTSIIEDELHQLKKLKALPASENEQVWYQDYKENIVNVLPSYMISNSSGNVSLTRLINRKKVNKLLRWIKAIFHQNDFYDYQSGTALNSLIKAIRVNLQKNLNSYKVRKYYLSLNEVEKNSQVDNYYVYPIHYHPESSTSVMAPNYTDEFNNILNISNELPFGTYLYVKDHISSVGVQSVDFYKKLSALPAVKLVAPSYNIKRLVLSSKGMITVNSTAGYEAIILDKPVYLLGRVFYENFANVYPLINFAAIREAIQQTKTVDVSKDIIAYYRYTHEGQLAFNTATEQPDTYYLAITNKLEHIVSNHYHASPQENQ